jgi:poly-gamma-glutamate capsule biosynthesis protein CapA/YwtB (metallophosphatase superfamily)
VSRVLAALLVTAAVLVAAGLFADGEAGQPQPGGSPTPTATPAETPEPEPERPARLTVSVSGDLLPHLPVVDRARTSSGYDFAPLLRDLRPVVRRADVAFCHVETPLQAGPPAGYPRFRTPPALAQAIRATGWDACSTASNHTVDQGAAGVRSTIAALDRAGLGHTGSASSPRGRRRVLLLRRRGVAIAFLAYTVHTNGLPVPHPWSVNLASPPTIVRDARRARRKGADAVVVNLHWGTEYRHRPDAQQLSIARRLSRSKAITALVGQHAHVVQPIRRVGGRWVVFGSGNLLSNQSAACCPAATQDGMVVTLHLRVPPGRRASVEKIRYTPTWVRHPDMRVLRARPGDRSWSRTVQVVGRRKGLRPVRP